MTKESYIETINKATDYDFDEFGEFLMQIELEDLEPLNIELNYLIYRVAWISQLEGFKAGMYFDKVLKGESNGAVSRKHKKISTRQRRASKN